MATLTSVMMVAMVVLAATLAYVALAIFVGKALRWSRTGEGFWD